MLINVIHTYYYSYEISRKIRHVLIKIAEVPASGESGNDKGGSRRHIAIMANQRNRRRKSGTSDIEQDGDEDHDSLLSFRTNGDRRRDKRPPSHRSMNDIQYQGQG